MIIIGGIGFYLNSLSIIILTWSKNPRSNCILALFASYPIHFIGYLSLVCRAKRIFRVLKLEKKYIDEIYSINK